MTKQKLVEDNEGLGEITPNKLLRRFHLHNEHIDKIRTQNLEAGLDVKRNNNFVSQNKLTQARSLRRVYPEDHKPQDRQMVYHRITQSSRSYIRTGCRAIPIPGVSILSSQ